MTKLSTLKEIVAQLVQIRKKWIPITLLMIVYVICLSSSPYFYKLLIDSLEVNLQGGTTINTDLLIAIGSWISMILATIGMRYFYGMILLENTQQDWFNFLMKSMKVMLRLPIDYHISLQHGEKQKIIDRASEAVWDVGDSFLLHIIPQFLVSIILIVSGLLIDVRMTLISLILLPIAILGIRYIGNTAYTNQKVANTHWDSLFSRITDSFTNLRIIRIFSREQHEISIIEGRFSLARAAQYNIRKLWLIFNGMDGFVTTLGQAITLSAGIWLMLQSEISLGTLFFFIGFTERIYGPIFSIFQKMQQMLIDIAGFEKMQKLYAMDPETDKGTIDFPGVKESLRIENLSFSYPSTSREVLHDISIEIKK